MAAPTLNGTTFYPSKIARTRKKVGRALVMYAGARVWMHRAEKSTWTLNWENIALATLNGIAAIEALTADFTYVDENGASFTVHCEDEALQHETAFIKSDGVPLYNATLDLWQV
jgi:hypothetical protein